ncbi:MAG: hypothetical protein Nk1A_8550 [Endomicrobiia bacterium]|nr:MAG: hypothetical protein Nk1A_8550 [Endomicrobiia bacterium]
MKVGNYNFYFKLVDEDGNESDFVSESLNVVCHIGFEGVLAGCRGGLRDENSAKLVRFTLINIEDAYKSVNVYYYRRTSDDYGNPVESYAKVNREYHVQSNIASIIITGFEDTESVTYKDINTHFSLVDSAATVAQAQGRLFIGNISKQELLYKDLQDLALRILPVSNR